MASARPVLVVPGGGRFADAVRDLDARVGLADGVAHALALHAMDQLGTLLAPLLPDAEPLTELVAPRSIGLLAAAPAFGGRTDIPESWGVTSDSLNAFIDPEQSTRKVMIFMSLLALPLLLYRRRQKLRL